jgi:hypothetical protein
MTARNVASGAHGVIAGALITLTLHAPNTFDIWLCAWLCAVWIWVGIVALVLTDRPSR